MNLKTLESANEGLFMRFDVEQASGRIVLGKNLKETVPLQNVSLINA